MATTSGFIKYQVVRDKNFSTFTSTSDVDKGNIVNNGHGRGNRTDMLVFPSDVGADPGMGNQGHYIMFFVNETIDGTIEVNKEKGSQYDNVVNEYKTIHKHETTKELQAWNQVLTKAGNIARLDRGPGAVVTKSDIEAVGGEAIFDNLQSSYKDVPIWDKLDEQMIENVGSAALAADLEQKSRAYADAKVSFNYGATSTAAVKRKETRKLKGGIALYMPPTISTSSSAEYTDTEIGVGAAMAMGMIDQFQNNGGMKNLGSTITSSLNAMGPEAKESLQNLALNTMGAMPGLQGAAALRDMRRGFIRAPRMELAFKGIGKRNFSYEFKLIPKSEEEATTVKNIVTAFRANMLPEFINGADRSSRFFKMPNTFDISYMYNGRENQYIHKISTCVCKSVNVTYGGSGGYQTFENLGDLGYDGAAPIETSIALAFEELELITQERVLEGY
jgi:hypothetical protein